MLQFKKALTRTEYMRAWLLSQPHVGRSTEDERVFLDSFQTFFGQAYFGTFDERNAEGRERVKRIEGW